MATSGTQIVAAGAPGSAVALSAESNGQELRAIEEHPAWPMISRLPTMLAVAIPLRGFKVSHLLGLQCGTILGSAWPLTEDVPLEAGGLPLGRGEFEVVEQRMALRLTRLA